MYTEYVNGPVPTRTLCICLIVICCGRVTESKQRLTRVIAQHYISETMMLWVVADGES